MAGWLRIFWLPLMLSCALGGQAQAKWLRAETQRFVVYSNGHEAVLREYALLLEDFDVILRMYHGIDQRVAPYRKLDIYLVQNRAELGRATTNPSEGLAGFYSAGEDDIFAVAIRDRGGSGDERNDTLFHEYTHHFVAQYDPFPYPGWLVEGWAEYFATTDIRSRQVRVGDFNKGRAWTLGSNWIPLNVLLTRKTHELNEDGKALYYGQAWLLTHYLYADDERRQQLDAYKHALLQGEKPDKAMETATGLSLKELQFKLQDYTKRGLLYRVHPLQKLAEAPITVTALPPSADDLLLENQKLMNGLGEEHQAPLLTLIRQRAAKYPGDRLAQIVLARAEIFYGDRKAGEAILKKYLGGSPSDAEALRLMATSRLSAAEEAEDADAADAILKEAQQYLVRANNAQPNNYQTFYYFAQSKMRDVNYPSDNTLKLLLDAHKVAPQVDSITFHAAQALVLRKQFDRALPMLERLANDPHGGGVAAAARTLIKQIADYTDTEPN